MNSVLSLFLLYSALLCLGGRSHEAYGTGSSFVCHYASVRMRRKAYCNSRAVCLLSVCLSLRLYPGFLDSRWKLSTGTSKASRARCMLAVELIDFLIRRLVLELWRDSLAFLAKWRDLLALTACCRSPWTFITAKQYTTDFLTTCRLDRYS